MLSLFRLTRRRAPYLTEAASGAPAALDLTEFSTSSAPIVLETLPSLASGSASDVLASSSVSAAAPTTDKLLTLKTMVSYLPHPEKIHYGGEDAHFISDYGGGAFGVADGVGGWQESGVNPAEYSRTFMRLSRAFLEGNDIFAEESSSRNGDILIDPRAALDAAHSNTKVPGSATACVLQLDQANRTLTAANLGDSGFLVIRGGKELIKSKPLQHYFDCPLQFGAFPEYVEATDTAEMSDLYTIALRPGDVIVAGTDGLWDNCFISEIIALAPKAPTERDVQRAASAIAALARKHASDNEFASPYTREALSQGLDLPWWDKLLGVQFKNGRFQLKQLTGGKMDDITVLVSMVDEVAPPPPPAPQPVAEVAEPTAAVGASPPGSAIQAPQPVVMDKGVKPTIDLI